MHAVGGLSGRRLARAVLTSPLLALLPPQGITAGVLDYDYAPNSKLVTAGGRSRRVWLNVSQEGRAGIDDLRERHMINGLKLSTEDFQPVTAYQVSAKGIDFLASLLSDDVKASVDGFILHEGEMLKVSRAASLPRHAASLTQEGWAAQGLVRRGRGDLSAQDGLGQIRENI